MTFQPEDPAADDSLERTAPNDSPTQGAGDWDVPHLNRAPDAPSGASAGTFSYEGSTDARNAPRTPSDRRSHHHHVDVPALATLAAGIPWVVASLFVVVLGALLLSWLLPGDGYVRPITLLWLLSGAVIFLPRAQPYVAQYGLGLRRPNENEQAAISAAWHETARQADIDPAAYSIWMDDREVLTSCTPGGLFVAVPRTATRLPLRQQAAVLAHEVSHHLGGHAWARFLVHWYAAPARRLARIYRGGLRVASRASRAQRVPALGAVGCFAGMAWFIIGAALILTIITAPIVRPALVLIPFLPWLSRWAEKRYDRVAADLGFGRDLLDLFEWWQDSGFDEPRPGGLVRQAFSTHPSVANRIHALRTYMTENGLT